MPSIYIVIGIAVASLLLGFGSGYKTKSVIVDAKHAKVLEAERAKLIESQEYSRELLNELSDQEIEIKVATKVITKEVIRYVPKIQKIDSACNITNKSKRLLNNLINTMPSTARGTLSSDREPSDIRTSDLITNLVINIERYKLVQVRCNALIAGYREGKW